MEFFRIQRDIPFMRHALVLNAVSFVTFLAAVFFLATRPLHLSIEFTGGTVMEVAYAQSADIVKTRTTVATSVLMARLALSAGSRNIDNRIKGDAACLSASTNSPVPAAATASSAMLRSPKLPRPSVMVSA